jgi:hypothetical protein
MSFLARRAGVTALRNVALRRAFASEAVAHSGPSFKLSEDQEAYQGERFLLMSCLL